MRFQIQHYIIWSYWLFPINETTKYNLPTNAMICIYIIEIFTLNYRDRKYIILGCSNDGLSTTFQRQSISPLRLTNKMIRVIFNAKVITFISRSKSILFNSFTYNLQARLFLNLSSSRRHLWKLAINRQRFCIVLLRKESTTKTN